MWRSNITVVHCFSIGPWLSLNVTIQDILVSIQKIISAQVMRMAGIIKDTPGKTTERSQEADDRDAANAF
jgi:hypothetical protein